MIICMLWLIKQSTLTWVLLSFMFQGMLFKWGVSESSLGSEGRSTSLRFQFLEKFAILQKVCPAAQLAPAPDHLRWEGKWTQWRMWGDHIRYSWVSFHVSCQSILMNDTDVISTLCFQWSAAWWTVEWQMQFDTVSPVSLSSWWRHHSSVIPHLCLLTLPAHPDITHWIIPNLDTDLDHQRGLSCVFCGPSSQSEANIHAAWPIRGLNINIQLTGGILVADWGAGCQDHDQIVWTVFRSDGHYADTISSCSLCHLLTILTQCVANNHFITHISSWSVTIGRGRTHNLAMISPSVDLITIFSVSQGARRAIKKYLYKLIVTVVTVATAQLEGSVIISCDAL